MSRRLFVLVALVSLGFAAPVMAASSPTDAALRRVIHERLLYDARVQVTPLNIETLNGEVTLRGEVSSLAERAAAIQVAAHTPGVSALHNELTVRPTRLRSDAALQRDVIQRIEGLADISGTQAVVDVRQGTATLSGVYPSLMALDKVVAMLLEVDGLRDVQLQVRVEPPVPISDGLILKAAANALVTDATVDAREIRVGVRDGIIVLEGMVPSLGQVLEAESLVRSVTGARGVESRLTTPLTAPAPSRPVG